jgi:hypothetical protein
MEQQGGRLPSGGGGGGGKRAGGGSNIGPLASVDTPGSALGARRAQGAPSAGPPRFSSCGKGPHTASHLLFAPVLTDPALPPLLHPSPFPPLPPIERIEDMRRSIGSAAAAHASEELQLIDLLGEGEAANFGGSSGTGCLA